MTSWPQKPDLDLLEQEKFIRSWTGPEDVDVRIQPEH